MNLRADQHRRREGGRGHRPLILVTPSTSPAGVEMLDHSISLSSRYLSAILDHGGVPVCLPLMTDPGDLAAAVEHADGILLSGGDDIEPRLHWPDVPRKLRALCKDIAEPARDNMELRLIAEVLRQRRPLLCICRGHQLMNLALGGTLVVDLPTQRPGRIRHGRLDRRCDPVHPVTVAPGSWLARWTGCRELRVNSTHHQAIDQLAPHLSVAAISPDGVIEATELRAGSQDLFPWFASVQFHPERLYDRYPEHSPLFHEFIRACRRS